MAEPTEGSDPVGRSGVAPAPATERVSTWAPLRATVFRNLWLAVLVSNVGTWMQTVGAQWLLVDEPNASTLVSLVQTASLLPVLLLALPAGALADSFDRRRLLLSVQAFQVAVGAVLTMLTALGQMPPALLLSLTFALGAGQALTLPAWQALIPDLVPRPQLVSASALGSISINVARAVGPALAGLLVAGVGVEAVFALNTLSFVVFAVVLGSWRPTSRPPVAPERFAAAVRAGGRYVRHSPVVRRILLRVSLFVAPGNALWALLPLVATRRLGLGSTGYGLLLASLGVGAVAGAVVLPRLRSLLSSNQLTAVAALVYGGVLIILALARDPALVMIALLPAGVAWMAVLSTVNAAMQLFLPSWVRARGLAIYQVVVSGGMAIAALVWGLLADLTELAPALLTAAAVMIFGAATMRVWPLIDTRSLDRQPAEYWPEPYLALDPAPGTGPVLVTARYRVRPENERDFIAAMEAVRRSVQRTGAYRWGLFRDGEVPGCFVEVYLVASWEEHLRQHSGRQTGADEEVERRARALAEGPPEVTHLLPANVPASPLDPEGPDSEPDTAATGHRLDRGN